MNPYVITDLVPQRPPMLLVDALLSVHEEQGTTTYQVDDTAALVHKGVLTEAGVIEHMAQSASALAGYQARQQGSTQPPLGMIGEVKNCQLFMQPQKGQVLNTTVSWGVKVENVSTVQVKTCIEEQVVATATLKIVIQDTK